MRPEGYGGILCNNPGRGPRSVHTLADSGGQESAASDRDLLPRGTGEEGALQFTSVAGRRKQLDMGKTHRGPEGLRHHLDWGV
jgi:hypothetical protein